MQPNHVYHKIAFLCIIICSTLKSIHIIACSNISKFMFKCFKFINTKIILNLSMLRLFVICKTLNIFTGVSSHRNDGKNLDVKTKIYHFFNVNLPFCLLSIRLHI